MSEPIIKKIKIIFTGEMTYLCNDTEQALAYAKEQCERYPQLNLRRTGIVNLDFKIKEEEEE
tara:strand:- start:1026 stop:1211 length:186 start_codon:yes stop_codon:yes gene_type:complete